VPGSCSPSCHPGLCCLPPASVGPSAARPRSTVSHRCLCSIQLCLFAGLRLCSVRPCSALPLEVPPTAAVRSDAWAAGAFLHPGPSSRIRAAASVPVPRFSSAPKACSLPAARPAHRDTRGRPWGTSCPRRDCGLRDAPNLAETLDGPRSPPGRSGSTAEGCCCNSLCCRSFFSQIRSGQSKEMVNSARERVCFFYNGRYKPGKEEHPLAVATFAFSGFQSRI